MSWEMDRMRSRNCSRTVVGKRPSTSDSGHESAQGFAGCCAEAVGARADICLGWSVTAFGVWVALDLVAVDVRQCSRERPSVTGFIV